MREAYFTGDLRITHEIVILSKGNTNHAPEAYSRVNRLRGFSPTYFDQIGLF